MTDMNSNFNTTDQRWDALVARDQAAERAFFYGVKTTGVFCRPTCASRLPRRENVLFFETTQQAEQAGFRPCKRCRPTDPPEDNLHEQTIIAACKTIEEAENRPSLEDLAAAAGLSPFYFQRLFKKIVGVTPKQYFQEKRSSRVRENLREKERVTDAIYESGYASNSQFYSQAAGALGMKPSEYKQGGKGLPIAYALSQSYLGWVLVAATPTGICAIDFGEQPETLEIRLRQRFPEASLKKDEAAFAGWVAEVLSFLESPGRGLNLPLDIQGTAFQRQVWSALSSIPSGVTASYADIAVKIGSPTAVRAVAQACAANRIAVAIPCHRVIRSDGGLGGYRWGLERKRALLERERG
jgi:AraC family transcriptional regulator of adaptative response/methylated-DNA-[protein]-cysteine methyltransferase